MAKQNDDFMICMSYPTINTTPDDVNNQVLVPLSCLREIGAEWILEFDLPMVEKKDISISLEDGNTITVEAKLREVYCDNSQKQQYEFYYFKKSITLPNKISTKKILAKFEHGRLLIRIPKILKGAKIQIE